MFYKAFVMRYQTTQLPQPPRLLVRLPFGSHLPVKKTWLRACETIPIQFRDVFHFFARKPLREKLFSFKVCEAALQGALQAASANKRREFWRETHTPLWLLIGRIGFLLDVSFQCKNHVSFLWLARTHLRTRRASRRSNRASTKLLFQFLSV